MSNCLLCFRWTQLLLISRYDFSPQTLTITITLILTSKLTLTLTLTLGLTSEKAKKKNAKSLGPHDDDSSVCSNFWFLCFFGILCVTFHVSPVLQTFHRSSQINHVRQSNEEPPTNKQSKQTNKKQSKTDVFFWLNAVKIKYCRLPPSISPNSALIISHIPRGRYSLHYWFPATLSKQLYTPETRNHSQYFLWVARKLFGC